MATAKQTAQLTAWGFLQTDAMAQFPWQQTPCRHCPGAASHSLFAVWTDGYDSPRFWCQKLAQEVDYQWEPTRQPKRDRPIVNSMADVRELRRWIGVKGKGPAMHVDKATGRTEFFTFSHPDPSKCGRFEQADQTPESYVRDGGVCLGHKTSGKDGKPTTKPRHPTLGWGTYQQVRELGFEANQISLCFRYSDSPAVVLLDLDLPIEGEALEAARPTRDSLMQALAALGCPTAPSGNPERRRAAVVVSDPDSYCGSKLVWTHPLGLAVEMYTPGSGTHAVVYDLDGPLPTITPTTLHDLLDAQGFVPPRPRREGRTDGGGGGGKQDAFDYFQYGELWAEKLANRVAFDPYAGGYHRWTGTHWANLTNSMDAEDQLWEQLQHDALGELKARAQSRRAEVLRGVKSVVRRELPLMKGDDLAVANGVINLRTGELRDFDPSTDCHRAVTGAGYQAEWSAEYCLGLLELRFTPGGVSLLDTEGVQTLVDFTALALSGRAQRHVPILYLWGQSGAGKGGTITLLKATLGSRAMGSSMGALNETGALDPTWATILMNDTLMVLVSESEAVQKGAFLASTGDNPMVKRHLYGSPIESTPRTMFVIGGVDPPSWDLSAGFWRRTGLIKFLEHETDDPIPPGFKADPLPAQCDALLTLAIRRAANVFTEDYRVARGNAKDLEVFRREVDPLAGWLQERHEQDSLEGQTLKALCQSFTDSEGRRVLPQRVMSNRLKSLGYATTRATWKDAAGQMANATFVHRASTVVDLHREDWIHRERSMQRSSFIMPSVN